MANGNLEFLLQTEAIIGEFILNQIPTYTKARQTLLYITENIRNQGDLPHTHMLRTMFRSQEPMKTLSMDVLQLGKTNQSVTFGSGNDKNNSGEKMCK